MGVGDGEGIRRRVNAGVQWDLRCGGEITIYMATVEVDDRHHLGRDGTQVGPGGGHRDQISLAGGDVAGGPDDQAFLGQVPTRTRHGFPCLTQK